MDPIPAGILGLILMMVFMLVLRLPIGFAMALSGVVGLIAMGRWGGSLANILSSQPYSMATEYVLVAIPMFVMMGWFIAEAGISADLFMAANKWLGWIRGGLAMAVTVACAVLAAVIGSSLVAAATVTPIALKEMRKYGYNDKLSTGICAAASNLGPMIPPSIILIIYGFITETSVGHLFTAGIGTGVLMAAMFMLITYLQCRLRPGYGPAAPRVPIREALRMSPGVYMCGGIIIICLGGIYTGFTTPTEAGALGAFVALCFGVASRRMKWPEFFRSINLTVRTTGMIFLLIFGAMIFASMLSLSTIPHLLVELLTPLSKWVVLVLMLVILIILGFFIDIIAVVMILIPALYPTLMVHGFDSVWLGILVTMTTLMGSITPPFGLVVFAVSGIVKDVPMWDIFMGAFPYFLAMVLTLILIILFPDIALFLVRSMLG